MAPKQLIASKIDQSIVKIVKKLTYAAEYKWPIKFKYIEKLSKTQRPMQSPIFETQNRSDMHWNMFLEVGTELNPKSGKEEEKLKVQVNLLSNCRLKAEVTIELLNFEEKVCAGYTAILNHTNEDSSDNLVGTEFPLSVLKKKKFRLLLSYQLNIACRIKVIMNPLQSDLSSNLVYLSSRARLSKERLNTAIVAGGTIFPVHREILFKCSTSFENLFKQTNIRLDEEAYVQIDNIDSKIMLVMLNYMYTGNFDTMINENVNDFLRAAEICGIVDLKFKCSNALKARLYAFGNFISV
ncbi:hypothetical protein TKK_0001985 [Trichogramma kaykai]|uniref:BTB domain-containing protein n=1 Tax=Trichogramma kaykai TaxID=54128 RepID=A0ABD2X8C6_9HYME